MNKEACGVCGEPKAAKYYGGISCNGCRVFFFRLITGKNVKNTSYCGKNGKCLIYYKLLQGACSGCRYRRCLEAGLQEKMVGKRGRHNYCVNYHTFFEKTTNISRLYGQSLNQGVNALIQTRDKTSLWTLLNYWKGYDDYLLVRNGEHPSLSGGDGNFTLGEILLSPRRCIRRNTAAISSICDYSTGVNLPFVLLSHTCRVTVMNAEWLAAFSEFHQMPDADRILLLRNSNSICLSHYESMKIRRQNDFTKYVSNSLTTPGIQNAREYYLKGRMPVATMMAETISKYQVTEVELLLVRLIAMFAPREYFQQNLVTIVEPAMSDEGRTLAIQTRIRLSQILAEYMKQSNTSDIHERLTALLSMEQHVKEIAKLSLPLLVTMVVHNQEDMDCPLGRDLYLTNS